MSMSDLATVLTGKNKLTLNSMEATGMRVQDAIRGTDPSAALREAIVEVENLDGQHAALAFALEVLRHDIPDNAIPAFLNKHLLEQITAGAGLEYIRGFASVITDVLLTLGD